MKDLFQFMIHLAADPQKQAEFGHNPTRMTEALGLSETNQVRLKSGNRTQINAVIQEELHTEEFMSVMGSCIVLDPGPDPTPDPDPNPEPPDSVR